MLSSLMAKMILVSKSVLFFFSPHSSWLTTLDTCDSYTGKSGWGRGVSHLEISAEKVAGCSSVVAQFSICDGIAELEIEKSVTKNLSTSSCVCNKCSIFPKSVKMQNRSGTVLGSALWPVNSQNCFSSAVVIDETMAGHTKVTQEKGKLSTWRHIFSHKPSTFNPTNSKQTLTWKNLYSFVFFPLQVWEEKFHSLTFAQPHINLISYSS